MTSTTDHRHVDPTRRLGTIIIADGLIAMFGSWFATGSYLLVEPMPTLLWNAVVVMAVALTILSALRPLGVGRVFDAVLRLSVANWVVALAIAWSSSFAWPLALQAALLPAAVAASYVTRERLRFFAAVSFVVAVAVAGLGLLQDATGLSAEAPEWLKTAVLLSAGPPLSFLVVLVALQFHGNLSRSLDSERVANRQLVASRQRVVEAADAERRRIERDLHDGAQSRLIGINLKLAGARASVHDPDAMTTTLDQLREEILRAHHELRELSHGVYPTSLTQHGITAAVQTAADRVPAAVIIDATDLPRLPSPIEATVYFCVAEALQNATRHARADTITVAIAIRAGQLWFEVGDDGVGLAGSATDGRGFQNMRDRLGSLGGHLEVDTSAGGGTVVRGVVPVGHLLTDERIAAHRRHPSSGPAGTPATTT